MKKWMLTVLAVLLAAALAGCGGRNAGAAAENGSQPRAEQTLPSTEPVPTADQTEPARPTGEEQADFSEFE